MPATASTSYRIRVKGHLAPRWSAWFDGLTVTNLPGGEAELAGPLAGQAALHGVLLKVRDLGLPLLSVRPIKRARPAHGDRPPPGTAAADRDSPGATRRQQGGRR
jgi:hypothetical protein